MKEGGKGGYEIELVPVEGGVSGPATPENFKFECGMAYLDCIYGGMEGWRPPQLGWISRLHPGGGGRVDTSSTRLFLSPSAWPWIMKS